MPKDNLELISYPIPIRGGLASLYLPPNLTKAEAERIKKLIDSLVLLVLDDENA